MNCKINKFDYVKGFGKNIFLVFYDIDDVDIIFRKTQSSMTERKAFSSRMANKSTLFMTKPQFRFVMNCFKLHYRAEIGM